MSGSPESGGEPIRVAFDATACLGVRSGIGRFAHEVLARIATQSDFEVVVFAVSWRGRDGLANVVPDNVRIVGRPMAARPLRIAWSATDHPRIEAWTGPVDVVHGPNYVVPPARRAARVVTVHDLTPLRFPELANRDTRAYPKLIERAVARGAYVQTPSEFVRAEVIEHFAVRPERVVAVPYGVTPLAGESPSTDAAAGRRAAGAERYVLALGTIEPRKDLVALVHAFDLVAAGDAEVHLVLAGADGWGAQALSEAIARARHAPRIRRLGHVSEDTRAALLRGASALAYPSRYEGFGLPPLEAMAAGVPVVCTNAGSLPEVLGDAACYVDAQTLSRHASQGIEELSQALVEVLDDESRRAEMIRAGHARAARYDWGATARAIADLYHWARADSPVG